MTYSAVFLITCLGVEIFRRWSLRREIVAVPNERSLHQVPIPQGGGLVMVIVCLFSVLYDLYNSSMVKVFVELLYRRSPDCVYKLA